MPTDLERQEDRERWWQIHDKDRYVCPDCGCGQDEISGWEVHHLDGIAGKIVGLCETCHAVRHGAERRRIDLETWKDEFLAIGD